MSVSVLRAFIAIEMSAEIRRGLDRVASELKQRLKDVPVRWVPVENIHLTLKFLGDVSVSNIEMLKKILAGEATRHNSFEISVGELGAFPSPRRPRVIWVKVEAPSALANLQTGVENETARLGYSREERPFSPHLTLGRVARNAGPADIRRIGDALESYKVGFLGATPVTLVKLYRSELGPGGAVYSCLFNAPLGSP
jgi:RNA 2',3'-cyclic 3'-phosphodiesterase